MDAAPYPPPEERRRLTRSRQERMWAGVCGGLSEYFDIDPVLVRLFWVVATVLTAGLGLIAYFCLAVIMPPEDRDWSGPESWSSAGMREPSSAGTETFSSASMHTPSSPPAASEDFGSAGSAGGPAPGYRASGESSGAGPHAPFEPRRPYRYGPYNYGHRRHTAGIILVALGVLFLASQAGMFSWIRWNLIWPAALIVIGIALLLRHRDW